MEETSDQSCAVNNFFPNEFHLFTPLNQQSRMEFLSSLPSLCIKGCTADKTSNPWRSLPWGEMPPASISALRGLESNTLPPPPPPRDAVPRSLSWPWKPEGLWYCNARGIAECVLQQLELLLHVHISLIKSTFIKFFPISKHLQLWKASAGVVSLKHLPKMGA